MAGASSQTIENRTSPGTSHPRQASAPACTSALRKPPSRPDSQGMSPSQTLALGAPDHHRARDHRSSIRIQDKAARSCRGALRRCDSKVSCGTSQHTSNCTLRQLRDELDLPLGHAFVSQPKGLFSLILRRRIVGLGLCCSPRHPHEFLGGLELVSDLLDRPSLPALRHDPFFQLRLGLLDDHDTLLLQQALQVILGFFKDPLALENARLVPSFSPLDMRRVLLTRGTAIASLAAGSVWLPAGSGAVL